MGEMLSIETVQALPYRDLEYDQIEGAIRSVCDSHELLRARLESVEAARRDAQESRFALIIQNEELGAELAATRARLESAEAAIREVRNQCVYAKWENRDALRLHLERAYAALGAASERSAE